MDGKFSAMYEADVKGGRPSIAPEKLMRAMLLQVLYSVRSERRIGFSNEPFPRRRHPERGRTGAQRSARSA